jgi:purine-binding chemotaxis protein CheW
MNEPRNAVPPVAPATGLQVACFHVGTEEFGLDIMRIKEIINPVHITPVPRAPAFVEGIVELRGAFLPVVDLRKRFEKAATPLTRESKYVIVAIDQRIVGLIVDRVAEVKRIEREQIRPAPFVLGAGEARFFCGVVSFDGRVVMLIDLDEVLSAGEREELRRLEQVEA